METAKLREAYRQFVTGVAFITTQSSRGPNVMAAEWTYHVSYRPFLISVHLGPGKATHEAIAETREFGVNVVPDDMVTAMGFAGHFTKYEVDKLSSELFETYPARRIKAPMIRGCLLNAECRLVKEVPMGDHNAMVGEVVEFSLDTSKSPIVLHKGARRLGPPMERGMALALAGTPMKASPGAPITADGELTSPDRASKEVRVLLADPGGAEVARAMVKTGEQGYFGLELDIPKEAPPGVYTLIARHQSAEGRARIEVRGP